jgi:VWFA-related protein
MGFPKFQWALALLVSALALTAAPELQPSAKPEVTTQADVAVFQSKVTLIEVPVVVRDKNGKAVGTLRQEDFQLFDKGNPQVISRFSVEKAGGGTAITRVPAPEAEQAPGDKGDTLPVIAPDHFLALLFDDIHTHFADQVAARVAAQKFIASSLKPADRVAIFTTSGQTILNFTDDRDILNKTLMNLAPHPLGRTTGLRCPEISFYQADQMANVHNAEAIAVAIGDYEKCYPFTPPEMALQFVSARARAVLGEGQYETHATIVSIRDVVRRMADMPGQRTLILASPGFFLMPDQYQEEGPAIDQAIRSGVVISSLSVLGIRAPSQFDASDDGSPVKDKFERETDVVQFGVLDDLASGTGGRSFHGNFLETGFRELGTAPEVFYLLGFSPQNLKLDGKFHSLKVSLNTSLRATAGMSLQARRGYYAPTHLATAEEDAKEEITQALFSRDEMNDIPVDMNTRFFKSGESEARLSVTSRVDVRKLRFRKSDDRDVNDVRVVCALFDRNGTYVQGVAKTIQMRLLDGALQNDKLSSGISVRSDFTVPPGTYVIRLVVRDAEGQTMTAQNGAVKIP